MTLSHVHLTSRLGDQVDTWRSASPEQVTGVKMKQMFWLSSSKLTLLILLLSALIDGRSQHWRAHIHQTKASRDEWTSPLSNVHHLLKDCPAAATVFILQLHRLIHCGRDSVSNYDPVANQSESGSAERAGVGGGREKLDYYQHTCTPPVHTHTQSRVSYLQPLYLPPWRIMGKFSHTVMVSLWGALANIDPPIRYQMDSFTTDRD